MTVLDLAAFAKEGISFVEKEDRTAILGSIKEAAQVLLGFADIFAYYCGEVDPVEVKA